METIETLKAKLDTQNAKAVRLAKKGPRNPEFLQTLKEAKETWRLWCRALDAENA